MIIKTSDPYSKEQLTARNEQKIILQSLSMDLLRAALGRHRGSDKMADRFILESKKWISQIHDFDMKIISRISNILDKQYDGQEEDLLMYSTIIRNRSN